MWGHASVSYCCVTSDPQLSCFDGKHLWVLAGVAGVPGPRVPSPSRRLPLSGLQGSGRFWKAGRWSCHVPVFLKQPLAWFLPSESRGWARCRYGKVLTEDVVLGKWGILGAFLQPLCYWSQVTELGLNGRRNVISLQEYFLGNKLY